MSAHTPARINPDTSVALYVAMGATGVLVVISFVLSFVGLSGLAPWAAIPRNLAWLVPLFIEGAILLYTYSALAARARGESTGWAWTRVGLWTTVSALANSAHAWGYGPGGWHGLVGVGIAALIPIGSLLGCHEIARRMIADPDDMSPETADAESPEQTPDADVQAETGVRIDAARAPGRRHIADEHRDEILSLYESGLSGNRIADRLGLGKQSVYDLLGRAGKTRSGNPDRR